MGLVRIPKISPNLQGAHGLLNNLINLMVLRTALSVNLIIGIQSVFSSNLMEISDMKVLLMN